MFQMFKIELLIGAVSVGTAGVAAIAPEVTGAAGSYRDFLELGALAIVLIVVMSYIFRVFLPRWQDSNDKRFEEMQELFKTEMKSARDDAECQRVAMREIFDQLRNDHRATLNTIDERFNSTLDKVAAENRELWKEERDRFSENYSRLETAMVNLCNTVCDALSEIKDRTR